MQPQGVDHAFPYSPDFGLGIEFDSTIPPLYQEPIAHQATVDRTAELAERITHLERSVPELYQMASSAIQSSRELNEKVSLLQNRVSFMENQLVQIPTLISGGMSTCTTVMEKIQAELKLLGEQLKKVKADQEGVNTQIGMLFKVTLQKAIKEGHVKISDEGDGSKD